MEPFTIFTIMMLGEAIVIIGISIKWNAPDEFASAMVFLMFFIGVLFTVVHLLKFHSWA